MALIWLIYAVCAGLYFFGGLSVLMIYDTAYC